MDKPNKYHNSCIYKIWKDNLIYIGSTFNFKQRVIQHKSRCTNEKSKSHNLKIYKTIRLNGGWSAFQKEIIENVCCENKKELENIERKYIESIGNLNDVIPCRTKKEYNKQNKEKIKEYYKKNKEKINQQQKQYYEKNKEKIKEYYKQNKDKIKEYYEQNKDKIKERIKEYDKKRKKIKIVCQYCNSLVLKRRIKRHQRSKKCLSFQ